MHAKNLTIEWTTQAEEDLLSIAHYIAADNFIRAESFCAELKTKIDLLAQHPYLGRKGYIPRTHELVLHQNYLALYRIEKNVVVVLCIKHAARLLNLK